MPALPSFPSPPTYEALSQSQRALCLRVRHFLTQELAVDLRGQTLLLAVSGGVDSLALLCAALLLRPVLGHAVAVAHVDHALRPESADEARYVVALTTAWNVPCRVLSADVRGHAEQHGMGLEEAARKLRYALLQEARLSSEAQWVCTGHHSGDLREDMLMRLARGTGWPALGGMEAVDGTRHLLRPLLLEEPEALRDLVRHAGLVWMEDSSNADERFTRNRVRRQLVPAFFQENPAFGEASRQLWRMAREDAAFWEERLAQQCTAHGATFSNAEVRLPAALLRSLHRAERLRLYVRALRHLARQGGKGQARATTLYRLDDALTQGRGAKIFQLPGAVCAHLKSGAIIFQHSG